MDVQADAWDFLRARDLVDDADAAEASGAGVLLTDEAREVKLENGLLFAQILKHYDVRCRPSRPASLFLRARVADTLEPYEYRVRGIIRRHGTARQRCSARFIWLTAARS